MFPVEEFEKSCLIYKKGYYGIFYLVGKNGKNYTVKVTLDPGEIQISKYIKQYAGNMPNLLILEGVYEDVSPYYIPFFNKNKLENPICKNLKVEEVFYSTPSNKNVNYFYYLTKACLYNIGYFLGTYKGTLSYQEFVNYSFEMLAALYTLHSLKIWHRDIKPANFLICGDDPTSVKYILGNKSWKIDSKRYIKLIDFGESKIVKDVVNPCEEFKFEVDVALLNVIQLMWRKIEGEKNVNDYEDLIIRMKNCKTNISDIILNAKIFDNLISNEPADINVNL